MNFLMAFDLGTVFIIGVLIVVVLGIIYYGFYTNKLVNTSKNGEPSEIEKRYSNLSVEKKKELIKKDKTRSLTASIVIISIITILSIVFFVFHLQKRRQGAG